jgi:two-component system, chemotaxis family, CheB/CheR fusion protein
LGKADKHPSNRFVIAALGASAGGLEALEEFFKHTPPDTGIGFIVVQHLAPDHKSALAELLARHTQMRVEEARDNAKVEPNYVYIIPPNATLTIEDGRLHVNAPEAPRGHRMPIDTLFRSLAEDRQEDAVCIMLSGTGSDGTIGLTAIKENGGMAMAQSIETAKYDTILRSAIATGLVDHILPVEEMPAKLIAYSAHLRSLDGSSDDREKELGDHTSRVYNLLLSHVGHDFSGYKESTIRRRLQRRMKALQMESVDQYLEVLEHDPTEIDRLFKEFLIGVTEFFRDPEAFDLLAREVIPKLFEGKGRGDDVRVCVVGCATGEEAYSIAILLCEHAAMLSDPPKIQVFATDIDQRGLEIARRGVYPAAIAEHVSPARLDRFFVKQEEFYRVKRELRDLCIFSQHSFLKDPPFSRQDLISCRNMMIYLGPDLQDRIVPLFHYALRRGGYLFLGLSESVNSHRELFQAVDKKFRIFQRKEAVPRAPVQFPPSGADRFRQTGVGPVPEREERDVPKRLESVILQRYTAACAVVRENGEAVYFSGRISRYLEHPPGRPDNNLLSIAGEGLRIPLRTALHRAVTTHERIEEKQISIQTNGSVTDVDLSVEPLAEFPNSLYIVVLDPVAPSRRERQDKANTRDSNAEATIQYLESEMRSSQEYARAMFEELESSNEELKSANEEYQSTNEELETSKEELQSFNEELQTLNAELSRKNSELDNASSDLQNLLDSTQLATIFLDTNLRIKKFTPAAGSVFRLITGDIGRPLSDLASELSSSHVDFENDVREVLRSLSSIVRQVTAAGGLHFQMRIMPYRTTHNVIEGVVVTFNDVTPLTEAKRAADEATAYAENIVNTVREPLLVLDPDLGVRSASDSFYKMFAVTPEETLNRPVFELGNRQWDIPELRRLLGEVLPEKKSMNDFLVTHDFAGIGRKAMLLNARIIQHGAPLILLAIEDITDRKLSEAMLRSANAELKQFAFAASHDLQEPLRMVTSYSQLLAKEYKDKLGKDADTYIGYAVEGAQRMETLLKDLRSYWAVNEEKLDQPVRVDCNAVLKTALDFLAIPIKEAGAVVNHDPLPTIMAEELPLALLFQNLISNALKYRRGGAPPQIEVSAQQKDREWNFSVRDNGIGIEEEHLEKIFAPFKRLHGREVPGSGMGLAICLKIVERYGGRIWAESDYGKGSTFHFTFPAHKEAKE